MHLYIYIYVCMWHNVYTHDEGDNDNWHICVFGRFERNTKFAIDGVSMLPVDSLEKVHALHH